MKVKKERGRILVDVLEPVVIIRERDTKKHIGIE